MAQITNALVVILTSATYMSSVSRCKQFFTRPIDRSLDRLIDGLMDTLFSTSNNYRPIETILTDFEREVIVP